MRDWDLKTLGRNTAYTGTVEEKGMADVLGERGAQ